MSDNAGGFWFCTKTSRIETPPYVIEDWYQGLSVGFHFAFHFGGEPCHYGEHEPGQRSHLSIHIHIPSSLHTSLCRIAANIHVHLLPLVGSISVVGRRRPCLQDHNRVWNHSGTQEVHPGRLWKGELREWGQISRRQCSRVRCRGSCSISLLKNGEYNVISKVTWDCHGFS